MNTTKSNIKDLFAINKLKNRKEKLEARKIRDINKYDNSIASINTEIQSLLAGMGLTVLAPRTNTVIDAGKPQKKNKYVPSIENLLNNHPDGLSLTKISENVGSQPSYILNILRRNPQFTQNMQNKKWNMVKEISVNS